MRLSKGKMRLRRTTLMPLLNSHYTNDTTLFSSSTTPPQFTPRLPAPPLIHPAPRSSPILLPTQYIIINSSLENYNNYLLACCPSSPPVFSPATTSPTYPPSRSTNAQSASTSSPTSCAAAAPARPISASPAPPTSSSPAAKSSVPRGAVHNWS